MILQTQNDILFCNLTGALRDGEKQVTPKLVQGFFHSVTTLKKKTFLYCLPSFLFILQKII